MSNPGKTAANPTGKALVVGCVGWGGVAYWDLNNDGRVDREVKYTGVHDGGLARVYRIDDNYNGCYDREKRIYEWFAHGGDEQEMIHTEVPPRLSLRKVTMSEEEVTRMRKCP